MVNRYITAVGIAGMAALAAWAFASLQPAVAGAPRFDVDDDTAADIIRRFAPALYAVAREQQVLV